MTEETKKPYIKYFVIICLLILSITIIYGIILNSSSNARGTFGDMFGGLNAIFSGFAFAGIIITILMQMDELSLTRDELRKSAEAQYESQIALNKQLQSMNMTSRIETVKGYIDAFGSTADRDKKLIAKSVLAELTEQLFYEDEFSEIVKPKIQLNNYKIYQVNSHSPVNLNFEIKNIGPSFKAKLEITYSNNENSKAQVWRLERQKNVTKSLSHSFGSLFEKDKEFRISISPIYITEPIKFKITYVGDLVKETWEQTFVATIKGGRNVQISSSKISKVKTP